MGVIKSFQDVRLVESFDDLKRFASSMFQGIFETVNGNLSFKDNFKGKILDVSFTAANVEQRVFHNLGIIPTGYLAIKKNATTIVYDGVSATTTTDIYLRSSAISEVKLLIF